MLDKVDAASKKTNEAVARFAATLCVIIAVFITVDALLRYAFANPIPGRSELSGQLVAYLVYFGIAYAMNRGVHVQVSVFTSRMPPRVQAVDEVFFNLVGLFAFGLLVFVSWQGFWGSFKINEMIMAPIDIPVWIGKFAIPIGAALLGFTFLLRLISSCAQLPSRLSGRKE